MKKKWKLLAVDLAILLGNVAFFSLYPYSFSPTKMIPFIVTVLVLSFSVVIHYWIYTNHSKVDNTAEQLDGISQKEDLKLTTYRKEIERIARENPTFKSVVQTFITQIDSLLEKEEALFNLIDLNDGKAKNYLADKNNDVQIFIVKNLKKFIKILIVYNAKTDRNRSLRIEEEKSVQEIFSQNREMIDLYDQLLDEVARMGNDFDSQDPGLKYVIDNLQRLRNDNEKDLDEEEDEIKLFVTGTKNG